MFVLADLLEGLTGRRPGDAAQPIRRFVIDSREGGPGDVFVALRGENTDGHFYISDAFGRGAVAAIVEQDVPLEALLLDLRHNVTQRAIKQWTLPVIFRVDNSMIALQELAKWWRMRLKGLRVVGITGSVGKSSTKELIATVLERDFVVLKSEGNQNNEIGLPLTLLQLEPKHQRAVLEMGMYASGEIARLAELAQPMVGVITNVGPVHLERLRSMEAIAEAKSELAQALPPEGVAILNFDDERVLAMRDKTPAQVLTYGLDPQADLWADEIVSEGLEGIHFTLHCRDEEFHVQVPLLGRHSVHTALRAVAVGLAESMSWDHILEGLQDRRAQLRLVAVPGPNGSTILDDSRRLIQRQPGLGVRGVEPAGRAQRAQDRRAGRHAGTGRVRRRGTSHGKPARDRCLRSAGHSRRTGPRHRAGGVEQRHGAGSREDVRHQRRGDGLPQCDRAAG